MVSKQKNGNLFRTSQMVISVECFPAVFFRAGGVLKGEGNNLRFTDFLGNCPNFDGLGEPDI